MTYPAISKGFTLIELLVVIALLSITLSMAVPFTTAFIKNQAKETSRQSVLSALRFARATAIESRQLTAVCSLASSGECRSEWGNSLSIFLDRNGNGKLDPAESVVRTINTGLRQWSQEIRPGSRAYFQWNSLGLSNGTPGSIEFCHGTSERHRFAVVISFSGRIRTSLDYDGDGVEERYPGTPVTC